MSAKDRTELFNKFTDLISAFHRIHTIEDLAQEVSNFLDTLLDIEYSGLYFYDFNEERLRLYWAKGFTEEERAEAERTAMDRHPGRVFRSREILYTNETEKDYFELTSSSNRHFTVRSRLYVPVMNKDQAVGTIELVSSQANRFTDFEIAALTFVANTAGTFYSVMLYQEGILHITRQNKSLVTIASEDPFPIFRIDLSYRLIYANKASREILDHLQCEIGDVIPPSLKTILEQSRTEMHTKEIEYPASNRVFSLTVVPMMEEQYMNVYGKDITLRKELQHGLESANSRLTSLIQNLQVGILVEDLDRRVVLTNKEFCRLFHIEADPEALTGMDCHLAAMGSKHLFLKEDTFLERIDQILGARETVIGEELETRDGRILERDFIPILHDERFEGIVWKYRDITQRKSWETQLEKARSEAEAANTHKSNFLARMSHEIRTPLNAILGMATLLQDTSLNMDQKKIVRNLYLSGNNLLKIVNEILDYEKIQSGKISLEKVTFNLRELIQHISNTYDQMVHEKNLFLKVVCDPKSNRYFIGDQYKIQQVLFNLISNSLKFTHEGGITMGCQIIGEDNRKVKVMFSVADTGIGIDRDKTEAIFDIFRQEDESVSRKYGGTGLGLSISKQLVELMGGELTVESEKGKGSCFTFTLELQSSEEPFLSDKSKQPAIDRNVLESKRILLVEDNEINQYLAKTILEKWSATVALAGNGKMAIDMLRKETYDLVLMDLEMPVLDGYAATALIRKELALNVPVIVLTANVMKEFIQMALDAGADDYLVKPFKQEELISKVVKFVHPASDEGSKAEQLSEDGASEKDSIIYHNLNTLMQTLDNDPVQLKIMVEKFLEFSPLYLDELMEAYHHSDYPGVSRASHKIKSSIDLVAAPEIKSMIRLINEYAREEKHLDELQEMVPAFQAAFRKLNDQLKREVQKM